MAAQTKDTLFLYDSGDAEPWKDYILEALHTNNLSLQLEAVEIHDEAVEQIQTSEFRILTLIMSPTMQTTLVEDAGKFSAIFSGHHCISVILLCSSQESFTKEIVPNYEGSTNWQVLEMITDDDAKIKDMFVKFVDLVDEQRSKVQLPGKIRSKVKRIFPDCVRKADEQILVVFREEVKGKVQVDVGDIKDIEVSMMNPYNIAFKAPAPQKGKEKPKLKIRLDNKVIDERPLPYKLPSFSSAEFLCQCLGIDKNDTDALDTKLMCMFEKSLPGDYSLEMMLKPETVPADAVCSKLKFPTLLHFAAYYGLSQLTAAILDVPGSALAFNILNERHENPSEMARKHHKELADYMDEFMETQQVVETVDLYMQMYQRNYYNENIGFANPLSHGYTPMQGGSQVPEAYSQARMLNPGSQNDDQGYTTARILYRVQESHSDEEDQAGGAGGYAGKPMKRKPPVVPDSLKSKQKSKQEETIHKHGEGLTLSPEQFMNMAPSHIPEPELPPTAMGSRSMDELEQIQQGFKRGEFNIEQVEMLYASWKERNREGKCSSSIKERQEQLRKLRDEHKYFMDKVENVSKEKKGFISRLTKVFKKSSPQEDPLNIQHLGNQYSTLPSSRDFSRASTISSSSTSSASSCGSFYGGYRDSSFPGGAIQELSDSDCESGATITSSQDGASRRSHRYDARRPSNRDSCSEIFKDEFKPPPRPPPPERKQRKPPPPVPTRKP